MADAVRADAGAFKLCCLVVIMMQQTGRWRNLVMLCVVMSCMGCSWFGHKREISVPVQESAAKQYVYATERRQEVSTELITDMKKLKNTRAVIRRAYEMVPENFPDDRRFTPLAKLEVIEMDAGLDHRRIVVSRGNYHKSIKALKALALAYPEYDFIQAKVLYDEGMIDKQLGNFPEAQTCFRAVRDKFGKHGDPVISGLAEQAAKLYNEVYVNE
jgi:hypothetical protein